MSLGLNQVLTRIKQVESLSTLAGGIVVQVTGDLSVGGKPSRAFVQTFVLAPTTPKVYYVHNSIFRYQVSGKKKQLSFYSTSLMTVLSYHYPIHHTLLPTLSFTL